MNRACGALLALSGAAGTPIWGVGCITMYLDELFSVDAKMASRAVPSRAKR
jgi:hypothetical protein